MCFLFVLLSGMLGGLRARQLFVRFMLGSGPKDRRVSTRKKFLVGGWQPTYSYSWLGSDPRTAG